MPDFCDGDDDGVFLSLGRGERLAIPLMLAGLASVPLLAAPIVNTPYDILRAFVLMQAAIVLVVQCFTISSSFKRSLDAKRPPQQPRVLRTLRWAYIARIAASILMVSVLAEQVVGRFGNHVLDWRSPALQLALLLLALAWGFMDRRILWLERHAGTPEFLLLLEQVRVLQEGHARNDRDTDLAP